MRRLWLALLLTLLPGVAYAGGSTAGSGLVGGAAAAAAPPSPNRGASGGRAGNGTLSHSHRDPLTDPNSPLQQVRNHTASKTKTLPAVMAEDWRAVATFVEGASKERGGGG